MIDAVVAYDDVLDIGWGVWGSQWDFDLERLTASFANPALDPDDPLYRVWGHVVEAGDEASGSTARRSAGKARRRSRPRTSTRAPGWSCG